MKPKDVPAAAGTEEVATGSTPRGLEPMSLEVVAGPDAGLTHMLTAGSLTLGTGAECDVRLTDPSVSRLHATVDLLAGAVMVRDLGSKNGTHYLEARIEQARVPMGGSLRLGRTTVRFSPAQSAQPLSTKEALEGLLGRSLSMRALFSRLERLGPSDVSVLLEGETGTGKEAIARALHRLSPRAKSPFVVFDCASANAETIESGLFGHVRGAFTGADTSRDGIVASVKDGTLLLDEVGELSSALQPKLLRLLEAREFTPLGDTRSRPFTGRVVASSQKSIEGLVKAGRFRSDLMFRLGATCLRVPPLRERVEDIPLLAAHFAREFTQVDVKLSKATLAAFASERWPGNVRQLRNMVERVLMTGNDEGALSDTEDKVTDASFVVARDRLLNAFERDYLESLLARHEHTTDAIAESKLSRSQFYRMLRRHQISTQ